MVHWYRPNSAKFPESLVQRDAVRRPWYSSAMGNGAPLRAAEFFAGIGLVRRALEQEDFRVVFANDIEPAKAALYRANFDASDLVVGDVRNVRGKDVPDIDLATASFPCTDLSLAGNRAGLSGEHSGMFWEFARVIREMRRRGPSKRCEDLFG